MTQSFDSVRFHPEVEPGRSVHVDEAGNGLAAIRERVLDLRRHEHERPWAGDDLLPFDAEGQLALEDVEGVVLGLVRVGRRAAAAGLDRDDREVEARRVRAAREELDVPTR